MSPEGLSEGRVASHLCAPEGRVASHLCAPEGRCASGVRVVFIRVGPCYTPCDENLPCAHGCRLYFSNGRNYKEMIPTDELLQRFGRLLTVAEVKHCLKALNPHLSTLSALESRRVFSAILEHSSYKQTKYG